MNSQSLDEINPNYICPICQEVYTNASHLANCPHTYCRKCLENILNFSSTKGVAK